MCNSLRAATASNARILSSLTSPNIVVAGGTGGIGRGIALALAKHCPNANITIVGRNEENGNAVLSQMSSNSKFIRADVSLMSEVRKVTQQISSVDMLVLTQGIMTMSGRTPTVENIDGKLALHYYGRALFVQELLPLLRKSSTGGKVLFVFESILGDPAKVNWDDMALEKTYSLSSAANHAQTFTDLIIQYFASQPENSNVTFTHARPGWVMTGLMDNFPVWIRWPAKGLAKLGPSVTPEDCAEYMVHGMLQTEKGWRCIDNKGEGVKNKKTGTEDQLRKVFEHTLEITAKKD